MTSMLRNAAIAAVIVLFAASSSAQEPDGAALQQRLLRSTKIVGATVRNAQNRKIGDIKDLLLDSRRGEVVYAVVNFGGVLGVGRKYHAVPWRALEPGTDGRYYVLRADRETLSQAPGFDKAKWPDMTDPDWSSEIDRYWSRMVGRGTAETNRLVPGNGAAEGGSDAGQSGPR